MVGGSIDVDVSMLVTLFDKVEAELCSTEVDVKRSVVEID